MDDYLLTGLAALCGVTLAVASGILSGDKKATTTTTTTTTTYYTSSSAASTEVKKTVLAKIPASKVSEPIEKETKPLGKQKKVYQMDTIELPDLSEEVIVMDDLFEEEVSAGDVNTSTDEEDLPHNHAALVHQEKCIEVSRTVESKLYSTVDPTETGKEIWVHSMLPYKKCWKLRHHAGEAKITSMLRPGLLRTNERIVKLINTRDPSALKSYTNTRDDGNDTKTFIYHNGDFAIEIWYGEDSQAAFFMEGPKVLTYNTLAVMKEELHHINNQLKLGIPSDQIDVVIGMGYMTVGHLLRMVPTNPDNPAMLSN